MIVGGAIIVVAVLLILAGVTSGSQQTAPPPPTVAPTETAVTPPTATTAPEPTQAPESAQASDKSDFIAWAGVLSNSLNYCELAIGMRPWTHTDETLQQAFTIGGYFSDNPTPRSVCRQEADELTYDTPPFVSNASYDRLNHARDLLERWARSAGDAAGNNLGVSDNPPDQTAQDDLAQGEDIIVSEAKKIGLALEPDTLLRPGLTPNP